MSRRHRAPVREITPDPKHNSVLVSRFINRIMLSGNKSLARRIVYSCMEAFAKRIKSENELEAFEKALENAMPLVEVKSRRVGGATYQVPIEIPQRRRVALAMKWIIAAARGKSGKTMIQGLTQELQDCYNNQGATIKKKDDTHRMAEANRASAHLKW